MVGLLGHDHLIIEWSTEPNQSLMSPSMNNTVPCHWR
jgi:hypothetical protein